MYDWSWGKVLPIISKLRFFASIFGLVSSSSTCLFRLFTEFKKPLIDELERPDAFNFFISEGLDCTIDAELSRVSGYVSNLWYFRKSLTSSLNALELTIS